MPLRSNNPAAFCIPTSVPLVSVRARNSIRKQRTTICSVAEPRRAPRASPPPARPRAQEHVNAGANANRMPRTNGFLAAFSVLVAAAQAVLAPSANPNRLRQVIENGKRTGGFAAFLGFLSMLYHSWIVRILFGLYCTFFVLLLVSHRAQTWLIYLHWIRPPNAVDSPHDVNAHGLAGFARSIQVAHLRGWHLLPTGPPFARSDAEFDAALAEPGARVIIFFHGNSGTRAFPRKRIRAVSSMSAHFRAHVLTFDYSGFGDTPGRPSEEQIYADARAVYAHVRTVTAPDANIIIYGQSLGSFVATDLAAHLSDTRTRDTADQRQMAVVLESAPSSLFDACKSHPTALLFRIIPGIDRLLAFVLKERLDSAEKIANLSFPLLVLHGDRDWMITPWQGRRLYDRASRSGNQSVTLRMFEGCGHNNLFTHRSYLHYVNEFLETHVPLR